MPALDIVSFNATAPGAGGAAATVCTGDSANVRAANGSPAGQLLAYWGKTQAAGFIQMTHAAGNDQTRDIRGVTVTALPACLKELMFPEPMQNQELMTVNIAGSAVGGNIETAHFQIYYPTLPGVNGTFISAADLAANGELDVTVQDTTTSTTAGQYSGSRALNAASDLLLANRWHAILGASIGVVCGTLTIKGTDLGNLRAAIPGVASNNVDTRAWFQTLSLAYNLPLIPVINSTNKAAIFIENIQDQGNTAVPFSLNLVRLKPAWQPGAATS